MNHKAKSREELKRLYSKYKDRLPRPLVLEYLSAHGIQDPHIFFGEDTWRLFGYAVDYRNLLVHECTNLGLDKFPSLIEACDDVLISLAKLGRVRRSKGEAQ